MTPQIPGETVFIDASSAILLYKADLFDDLLNVWQIVMAGSVFREITETGYPGAAYFKSLVRKRRNKSTAFVIREPSHTDHPLFALKSFQAMDKGEKETLQLFCHLTGSELPDPGTEIFGLKGPVKKTGPFILVDDGRAARFCHARQLPFINALLIPKIFWYSGFMEQKKFLKKTACLCALGRYSKKIVEMAGQFTREELTYFIAKDSHE